MNPPLAISPLIAHIPHAVPVVIVWGIMLRYYFVQRKLKAGRGPAPESSTEHGPVDRPVPHRVWAADDAPGTSVLSKYHEVPTAGRTPAGRP
jgi:hypothetical protein